MYVIGTAGHVDHGKSTLVEALTGIHPDRLKEEREREMTIDLGFAWLKLPNGEEVGIVDVPGHRDFIENMLAGVGGIDAALFVVAADEGIMPQTREHLAILDLLQVQRGLIVITKIDLVNEDWLTLVEEELQFTFSGTVLQNASIIPVSARTGQGIPDLIKAIECTLLNTPQRIDLGRPRLPVDRVFTIPGFGTVVTGTLLDGKFQTGDEIVILPGELRSRIRGLQTHKKKEDIALPGSRTAVNLSNISLDEIQRGNVIAHPGEYLPTSRMDVNFRLLPVASRSIKHDTQVKLFIGAVETLARIRLLGIEELHPGDNGWLQLELNTPVVAVRGDHYILRRPSPGETLGGGTIVDPHPTGRHKRFSIETISRLKTISEGTPSDIFFQTLQSFGAAPLKDVYTQSNLEMNQLKQAIQDLSKRGLLVWPEFTEENVNFTVDDINIPSPQSSQLVSSSGFWEQIVNRALKEVKDYHQTSPLRPGMPREELKSRIKSSINISSRVYNALIGKMLISGLLEDIGSLIRMPGFTIKFTSQETQKANQLLARFRETPYSPPSIKECQNAIGEDLYSALLDTDQLMAVSQDVVFLKNDYYRIVKEIKHMFRNSETITAAQVRDKFKTSRKYALALLEYLDTIGVTVRDGDYRRLKKVP